MSPAGSGHISFLSERAREHLLRITSGLLGLGESASALLAGAAFCALSCAALEVPTGCRETQAKLGPWLTRQSWS